MLFNSFVFLFLFLPITYAVFWALRTAQSRYVWLTITGYVFYGYWDARFCLLMALSTLVSYTAGLGLLRWSNNPGRRKACLVVAVSIDLCVLGFFKYANFAMANTVSLAAWLGLDLRFSQFNIILPIGISFYTFHTITYVVDSYRGVVTPTRNLFEFSAYVSLFSQLVAGPIVRFRQIEQDLERLGHVSRTQWLNRGLSFFVIGMVEKVVIADSLAAFVNPALANYTALSTAGAWLAMLGYTFQLYFDFSGYSSMAVGLGYMFGLRIPQNFNSPYKALDPADFWRRWHISLSTCMRDYLYIPFGGNRGTSLGTYRNLLLTMLVGGLWHGAAWTFVAWGAFHGAVLAAHRALGCFWDGLPATARQIGMFTIAVVGWVFFRATDFTMAAGLLRTMFVPTPGELVPGLPLVLSLLLLSACWALVGPNVFEMRHELGRPRQLALTAAAAACLAILAGNNNSPFLYFQF
jgi:alginate O-acetyltransferase complex protein AlgI